MWFNKKSNNRIEDKGWQAMKVLLDKELPEKKSRRSVLLWLWPVAAGFIGVMLVQAGLLSSWKTSDLKSTEQVQGEINATYETPARQEVAPTYAITKGVNTDQVEAKSLASSPINAVANTPKKFVDKDHHNRTASQTSALYQAEKKMSENRESEGLDNVKPSENEVAWEVIEQQKEDGHSIDMTVTGNTHNRMDIAALPAIEAKINRVNRAPQMDLALVNNIRDSKVSIRPYLSAGIFGPPALDRAGYSLGGGVSLQFTPWLGLSFGAAYEKYRGQYDYQSAFAAINDVNEFSAFTDVRQIAIPVMLQLHLPKTRFSLNGGIAKNFVQNTANYYAIPSTVEASTLPNFDINSKEFASEAAASIPSSYYEWQVGARMRIWKSVGLSVHYREQFEKQKNGIIPGYNHVGVGLTLGLQ